MKLFSPEPLSRLGATVWLDAAPADARALSPYPELLGVLVLFSVPLSDGLLLFSVFCFLLADWAALWRSEYDSEVDKGLGGRLDMRGVLLDGGRGKAPMLETFRRLGSDVRGV